MFVDCFNRFHNAPEGLSRSTIQQIIAEVCSHIQIPHIERVLLDEFAAGFDLVAHQDAEEIVGAADVVHADLQQRAVGGVERGVAEFFGVHFAEAFEAGDLQAFFAGGADGGGEAAEVFEAGFVFAAAEGVAAGLFAGALLGDQGFDGEAEFGEVGERGVDRADFVELDDAEARGDRGHGRGR